MMRRSLAEAIGGPYALSIWSWLLPFPLLLALRLVTPTDFVRNDLGWYLLATIVSQIAVAIAMWLPARTLLHPGHREPRPWAALVTFAVLGVVRVLAISMTETVLGLPLSRPLVPEVIIGALQGVAVLGLIAAWVNTRRRAREIHTQLRQVRSKIAQMREWDLVRTDELLHGLLDEVTLRVLAQSPTEGADEEKRTDTARVLREVAEEFVRPLSHQVGQDWTAVTPPRRTQSQAKGPVPATRQSSRLSILGMDLAAALQPANPVVVTAVMVLLALGTLVRLRGLGTALLIVATAAPVLYAGAWLVRRVMRRPSQRPAWRFIALPLCYLLTALGSVVSNAVATSILTADMFWSTNTIFTFTFIGVIASLVSTVSFIERRDEARLASSIAEESRALEAASIRLQALRIACAQYLHSSVQGELVAAAMSLGRAGTEPDARHALERAFARMERQIEDVARRESRPSRTQVTELLNFWVAAIDLTVDIDPACWSWLDRQPRQVETLTQIMSEALINAVRHGSPGPVCVALAHSASALRLTVSNPGSLRASGTAGLGLGTVATMTTSWSLSEAHGTVTLAAEIAPTSVEFQRSPRRPCDQPPVDSNLAASDVAQ